MVEPPGRGLGRRRAPAGTNRPPAMLSAPGTHVKPRAASRGQSSRTVVSNGLLSGLPDGSLDSLGSADRAQAAVLIHRLLAKRAAP
ncbi:MAG: hypothetical protein ACYC41_05890 [Bacillota bacterium]